MGALRMVQQWVAGVNDLFSSLSRPLIKSLARFSFAMCQCGHCQSGRLAASVVSSAKPASSRRRWERLLANDSLDASAALHELAHSMLANWAGRDLLLILDETPQRDGLRSMRLGVAYQHRMLTINARCYPANKPPMFMPKMIKQMLKETAVVLPPGARVTFVCDRGLAWPSVMQCAQDLGWEHVLRLQRQTKVKLADGTICAAEDLVKKRGGCWDATVQIFKKAGWKDAHVTVVWDKRAKQPWILAARQNGTRGMRAACRYVKRGWCEQSFRDEKSSGFHWRESRVDDPQRAMIIVLVMTLATLLSISLGTWLIKSGHRRDLDPRRLRRLSIFQLGIQWLIHAMNFPEVVPWPKRLPCLYPP